MLGVYDNPKRILNHRYNNKWCEVEFMLDTGVTVNGIPLKVIQNLDLLDELKPTILTVFNDEGMKPNEEINFNLKNPVTDDVIHMRFLILDRNIQPILGCQSIISRELISVNHDKFQPRVCYQINERFSKHNEEFKHEAMAKIVKICIPNSTKQILLEHADVFEDRVEDYLMVC